MARLKVLALSIFSWAEAEEIVDGKFFSLRGAAFRGDWQDEVLGASGTSAAALTEAAVANESLGNSNGSTEVLAANTTALDEFMLPSDLVAGVAWERGVWGAATRQAALGGVVGLSTPEGVNVSTAFAESPSLAAEQSISSGAPPLDVAASIENSISSEGPGTALPLDEVASPIGASPSNDGSQSEGRQLQYCRGVGDICFINAQCCSARCVLTHRCGPPVWGLR